MLTITIRLSSPTSRYAPSVTRPELAGTFAHPGVVAAYRHRPPYPEEVFTILEGLIADRPRGVLDLGAGEGRWPGRSPPGWTMWTRWTSRPRWSRRGGTVPAAVDGVLEMPIVAALAWGRPCGSQ
jgi:hypothetical protein